MHIKPEDFGQVERVLVQDYWYNVVPNTFHLEGAEYRFTFYAKGGRQVQMQVQPEQVAGVQLDEAATE
ncbi:hypothetical protein A5664_01710 [Mycolicibacterium fortuitum]|uniref:hypothetical protein n=1 Tax=Mycolicibacterium fortuitum TaxID=1766 RepID=UPI0007EC500D|nr:hypothetical protein [Mycolicibacterium fortuitum]OBI79710.1 hypothetical protein A5664_01710 [Mycolicibacterium fortuitum]